MNKKGYFTLLFSVGAAFFSLQAEVPPGYYYQANGLKKAELKSALHQIVSQAKMLSYGSGQDKTWQGFYQTDQRADGSVWDMYSNEIRYFAEFNGVTGMHIEHSLPKSWWGAYENNAYKDLFHLYPADGITNITKSNLPLGEAQNPVLLDNGVSKIGVNGFTSSYTGNCFEPANEYKGDFARSYLYMATAYEDLAANWNSPMMDNNRYPVWKRWAVELLLKWHREDPVSEKEKERQEAIYQIQGNRNPFIDYPELAEYIWGKDTLQAYSFPKETAPFLITPNRWSRIEMGVLMQNDATQLVLKIQGLNLKNNLKLNLANSHSNIQLSDKIITPAQAAASYSVQINFTGKELGYTMDTLVINSEDLEDTLRIPMKGLVAADFMVMQPTEVTAKSTMLNWIKVPSIHHYLVNLYQGDPQAGDLFISQYIEGSSWNKAIEIYNGTGTTVDLSKYSLKWQNNGLGNFYNEYVMNGVLESGRTALLACTDASAALIQQAQFLVSKEGFIGFNGNDAVALYHNGIQIDVVGEVNNPNNWGADCTLIRKSTVTHPTIQYDPKEWITEGIDYYDEIGLHQCIFDQPNYLLERKDVGEENSFYFHGLEPEKTYTYRVIAVDDSGNELISYNSMQVSTQALEAPNALEATQVKSHALTANWESVADASHYLLDLYQMQGSGELTEVTDFNQVVNGKPLPDGWSGTASGSYTSAASSGKEPNSIGLKTNEWLQTRSYHNSAKKLSFMYRYTTTSGNGSYVVLEGLRGEAATVLDSLKFVNSGKYYPEYEFQSDDSYDAFRFRFANREGTAYFALDDVQITYGTSDTIFIKKDLPVTGYEYTFTGLQENTAYSYRIRSAFNDAVSAYSNVIEAQTTTSTSMLPLKNTTVDVINTPHGLQLKGIASGAQVIIYDLEGRLLKRVTSCLPQQIIPLEAHGILLIRIVTPLKVETIKVIR